MEEYYNIIVDNRELKNKVARTLFSLGARIIAKQLEIGDYIPATDVIIERKTVEDFLQSIIDQRLFRQAKDLKTNAKKPLLIVEGKESIYTKRNIHPNAIRGALTALTLDFKLPILFTENEEDTAQLILAITKREKKDPTLVELHGERKPLTDKEQQEYIISSFPGVGRKTSQDILNYYKTIKEFANTTTDEIKKVPGIGDKNAEKIIRILKKEYL